MRGIRAIASSARASRDAEFTQFVQDASPSLLRAALVLLDSREEAEDALQVTLLRTYRRWEQAKEAPLAYARAVLVNACRERWRHRGRHPEISRDVDELANVVSFAEAVDRRHMLVGVLRQLPGIQREVLVCRYLLDATVAETATALESELDDVLPSEGLADVVIARHRKTRRRRVAGAVSLGLAGPPPRGRSAPSASPRSLPVSCDLAAPGAA